MLVLTIFLAWISTAFGATYHPCPVNEDEVFRGIENASVPETSFDLYTRRNTYIPQKLTDESSLLRSNFDPEKRTVIAVHGHFGHPESFYLLRSAYLRYMDCNFITVNWTVGAAEANGTLAIRNTVSVARFIANGLDEMKRLTGSNLSNVHVIGWSLGGQLVGYIGKYVRRGIIGRITAIDPSGVCFAGFSPQHRLYISDATFVDVITTNGGPLLLNEPAGHLTFAVDGGKWARGCGNINNGPNTNDSVGLNSCSHVRALELLTASLGNSQCLSVGYTCSDYDTYEKGDCFDCGFDGKNCAALGIDAEKYADKTTNKSVMMYLDTTFTDDFCLFQYHIEVKLSKQQSSKGILGTMYIIINAGRRDEDQFLLQPSANYLRIPELLQPGKNYTYLLQSHKGPLSIRIRTIHMMWVAYTSQKDSKISVQCLTVIPMNNIKTNRRNMTLFAKGSNIPVPPDTMQRLRITSSC